MAAIGGGAGMTEVDNSDTMQLIRQAVLFENEELLYDLLNENPQAIYKVDRHGRTPLMLAAHNGRAHSLQVLLTLSPETLQLVNGAGKTALHLAAEAGEATCIKVLLDAGSDLYLRDEAGHCALEAAQIAGHEQAAAVLIEAIQTENERVESDHKKLISACIEGSLSEIDEILSGKSERVREYVINGKNANDETALFVSCTHGQLEAVQKLLTYPTSHALVNHQTKDTVLHAAVSSQNLDVLAIILGKFPALVANFNCDNCSCLHWAAENGNIEILKKLMEYDYPENLMKEIDMVSAPPYKFVIDVNQGDIECRTPFYLAVAKGHLEVVQYMLQFRCGFLDGSSRCPFQIDVYCNRGRTPLMIAAFNQTFPLLTHLIESGADINLPLAVLESDVNVEEARCVGSGALVEATRADAVHIVHYLLDKGALDTDNRALTLAASKNNEKLIRVFLTRLVFPDSEYKVNKRNVDVGQIQFGQSLLPSALCPSKSAMLNWGSSGLENVQSDWFIAAALQINPRLRTTRLSLAAITRVDLSCNNLTIFPSVLFQMPSLRLLNLSENKIKNIDLPSYYISSTCLENLNLKSNLMESISPNLLLALPKLSNLDISHNHLTCLPEFIWLCPSLKELNVSCNQLSSLPVVGASRGRGSSRVQQGIMQHSASTTTVDVSDLPENVESRALLRINVWQEKINLSKVDDDDLFPDFPVTSSNTLTTLNLSGNKFQAFPLCLACTCPRLTTLNISDNQLAVLPPVSCIPPHIRNLDISNNQLKESFQQASTLYNVCHAVPPSQNSGGGFVRRNSPQRHHRSRSKSAVRSQRSLSVSRNQQPDGCLEDACVHKRHDSLARLKVLNLNNNKLSSFSVVLNGKLLLPSVTVIEISKNILKNISPELSKLATLSVLNLSQNKDIRELPPELGMLSRLWSLSLKGCSLKEPLDSMVNTDNCKTVEIVAYLKTILEESKTFRHLKLMILGEEGVGKSTLWDAFRAEGVQKRQVSQGESVRFVEWKYEAKRNKNDPNLGPVGFAALDYIGQREYFATHPYFTTRRSVFVVVWRVPDGETAFPDIQKWLVSIQARAPNCCVILVGTHVDQVGANPNRFPSGFLEDVEMKVRRRFMVSDSDKRGLPKIMDLLFINAKVKQEIKTLLNVIYKSAWEVRVGKERALDQQIPSSYIAMFKVVRDWAADCRKESLTSCCSIEDFKENVKKRMVAKFGRFFRDDIEFHAACSFLHDCGEIIHFEDAALRQVVFIDPVWLADFLARCASLRASNLPIGLITQETLHPVSKQLRSHLRSSLLDLLHKFELALVCHSRQLILPSRLPDEYRLRSDYSGSSVKLPAKMNSWQIRNPTSSKYLFNATKPPLERGGSLDPLAAPDVMFNFCYEKKHQLRRLYVMAYVPAGFWSRLMTRIMGDQNVSRAIESLFSAESVEEEKLLGDTVKKHIKVEWLIWKTGIELLVKGHSVFVLKQFCSQAEVRDVDYSSLVIQVRDDQKRWCPFPLSDWTTIEMLFPSLIITSIQSGGSKATMRSDVEGRTRLCALIADLVDTLLEDWYPALGTRFVHSSEGVLLVNRLVPCYKCVDDHIAVSRRTHDDNDVAIVKREESFIRASKTSGDMKHIGIVNCFTIEECMLAGRETRALDCPSHGEVRCRDIAPDTVFADIESSLLINESLLKQGRMLGRGAFGFVFRATVKLRTGELNEVAQKMLEPVDPGPSGKTSAITAYKAAADKWRREALEFACRAYCTSRQELNLLCRMRHPNVIGLIGVCVTPLSLVVELAPLGALNQLLSSHKKSGAKLSLPVIRESAMQVARALEYLHLAHIIYRDLKSENVLGWRFPTPFSNQTDVLLKLGDYGISRSVLPSGGAKGFGGTEGFMAPEIVRFNGEEEYTQKVDVFSFREEHVKERLLDGARPVLLPHELLVPCSMLDLLVQCWDTQPEGRPSSSQVVGFCSAPEFSHILDICELEDVAPINILSVPLVDDLDDPEDFEAQLWLSGLNLTVMSCTQYAWVDQKAIKHPTKFKFLSKVRETIWACEENTSDVVMFTSSLHEAGRLQLPSLGSPLVKPPEIIGNEILLLVCQHELILLQLSPSNSVALKGNMRSQNAITTSVFVAANSYRQIWTGHAEGRITIHNLTADDVFSFSSSLYLRETDVTIKEMVSSRDGAYVWISFVNDSRIYCLDVERRQVNASLDVKKVVPGSETIFSMDMEVSSCNNVTCMSLLERSEGLQLYIGTTKGLMIVVQAIMLQPISACRPYSHEISSICVVEGPRDEDSSNRGRGSLSTASSDGSLGWVRERVSETIERLKITSPVCTASANALVATVGKGFRSLSHRFVSERPLSDLYSIAIWRTDDWA
ncbi:unnamed protein product [Auanema sp. JU1783]|nr:unnamed protein product [Auanema sp. JU1783]